MSYLPLPTLDTLSLTDRYTDQELRLHSRSMMLTLSYLIEDQVLTAPDSVLVAAFQRFSYLRPQRSRYQALTAGAQQTVIIGYPDHDPPALPATTYLPCSASSPLLHEWVVLVMSPTCSIGLLARDPQHSQPDERSTQFAGALVTDVDVLDTIAQTLQPFVPRTLVPRERDRNETRRRVRQLQAALQSSRY